MILTGSSATRRSIARTTLSGTVGSAIAAGMRAQITRLILSTLSQSPL